ncbi:MAG: hypothetical protein OXT09_09830 [Myxococcales bacterium]|nr:hypothetical protein [Myxococcales bacterium]
MSTTQNQKTSTGTWAAIAVGASVAVPVLAAIAFPAQAAFLAPLALAVPFISMSMLEGAVAAC